MKFHDLGLNAELLKAIADVGYDTPTPIQQEAIPVILTGRDVLGCAQTGTGKTAGFTLPMIEILSQGRAKVRMPRSLILAPTRELATQVSQNFDLYGKYSRLSMALLIGGESFSDQEKVLDRGADVLIATPGRLLDMFDRGRILLNDVKILVIDEADRMLDMGFIPDVERIVGFLPKTRQTLFFSATMAPEIKRLADAFLTNPKEISVSPPASTASAITQRLVVVNTIDKRESLRQMLRTEKVQNALIFCNRKRDVEILYRSLTKHGFSVQRLHGDMPQSARTETLEKFKASEETLLVCSDVAARGLDIAALPYVFNFDVPIHAEDYVHRIGRTGRAGKEGNAITIATAEDGKYITAIEKLIGKKIPVFKLEGLPKADLSMEGRPSNSRNRKGEQRPRKEKDTAGSNNNRHHDEGRSSPPRQQVQQQPTQPSSNGNGNGHNVRSAEKVDPNKRSHRRRAIDEFGIGEMSHPDDVIGFGQHVPNFIVAPIVFPSKTADKDEAFDDDEMLDSSLQEKSARPEKKPQEKSGGKKAGGKKTSAKRPERNNRQRNRQEQSAPHPVADAENQPVVQEVSVEKDTSPADAVPSSVVAQQQPEPVVIETATPAFEASAPQIQAEEAPAPVEEKKKTTRSSTAKSAAPKRAPRAKKAVAAVSDDVAAEASTEPKPKKAPARKKAAAPKAEGTPKPPRKRPAAKKAAAPEATPSETPSNETPTTADGSTGE